MCTVLFLFVYYSILYTSCPYFVYCVFVYLLAGQPLVLKLLRCRILRFFAPQGRHDSRINVKFGTLRRARFYVARGMFGDFRPKKYKNLPKNFQSCKLFRLQGRIPRPILVKFMCCMRVAYLRNVLKFGALWFISDKFVGTKLRWVICPPPKFLKPPSSETTGRTQKFKVGPKMVRTCSIDMPSLVAICRRTAAREEKMGVFCLFFLFVLFVTLTVCVSLDYIGALTVRAILLPFIGRFCCSFQHF